MGKAISQTRPEWRKGHADLVKARAPDKPPTVPTANCTKQCRIVADREVRGARFLETAYKATFCCANGLDGGPNPHRLSGFRRAHDRAAK